MHQAIAFAIASEFCRKLPFARNFRNEDKISQFHSQNHSHSLANSFARLNSEFSWFEIWWLKFDSEVFRGASRIRIRIRSSVFQATAILAFILEFDQIALTKYARG